MNVVVLGGGYAGVALVGGLEDSLPEDAEITLVDESDTHLVQHLLHRVVRTPDLGDRIAIPFEELLDRTTFRQSRVTAVNPDEGRVELEDGSLDYDLGAVCLGVRTAFHGLPGVEDHATPLKRLVHAHRIREDFLQVCDLGGRVVVGGAGLSGIQIAGEVAAMVGGDSTEGESTNGETREDTGQKQTSAESGGSESERGDPADVEVLLLEQKESVAPAFPAPFQRAVADELDARGVVVRTEAPVDAADEDEVVLVGGERIPYEQFIWTGGITGPASFDDERKRVRSTLRLGDRTFAAGDAVEVVDANGTLVPATAQTAVRQASVAATNLTRLAEYRRDGSGFEPRFERYTYDPAGWVVTVGDGTVAQVGSSVVRGVPARALKATIGARYLGKVGRVQDAIEFAHETFNTD